ncbi:MAG: ComEC/Rec2 family competence protein, partial [Terriglobales bacterium]
MRTSILGFATGACLLQNAVTLPSGHAQAACALAAALLLGLARVRGRVRAGVGVPARALAGTLLGYAWAALLAQAALAPHLAPQDEGRDLAVVGVVNSLPYVVEQGVRFNFHVERSLEAGVALPPQVALGWYAAGGGQPIPELRPGERWQLTVRLQRPHGNANPGGFDYEVWLLEQ